MIRLACPKCKERLVLDEGTRGQVGACPDCGTRFRIPAAAPGTAIAPGRPKVPLHAVVLDRPRPQDLNSDDDNEDRPRRKKRRKRQRSAQDLLAGMNFTIVLGVLAGVGVLSLLMAVISARLSGIPVALGVLIALLGNIWFLICAFKESVIWGLGCLLVPLVGLIFLAQHFEETWRPFVVSVIGALMIFVGTMLKPATVVMQPWPNPPVMPRGL